MYKSYLNYKTAILVIAILIALFFMFGRQHIKANNIPEKSVDELRLEKRMEVGKSKIKTDNYKKLIEEEEKIKEKNLLDFNQMGISKDEEITEEGKLNQ